MKKYWINFAFYFSFQIVSIYHISGQCSPNNSPCDDGNACTYDICVDGVCLYFNNSNSCDDGNPCTINDVCMNGVCQGISPATYTVTSQASFGIGSLRHRIINSCQGDTIIFDPNVDTVYLDQIIYLPHSIIIKGNGVNNTIINGQLVTQAFTILSTQILHLENLSMINCKSSTNGGAFFNQGIVKMKHVSFKNNYEGSSNKAFTNANEVIITQAGTVYITD